LRVFITGASGYVGTAATTALAQRGHTPMGLARSTRVAAAVAATGATPVRGSLGDVDLLRELAGQADAVLHLGYDPQHPAAGTSTPQRSTRCWPGCGVSPRSSTAARRSCTETPEPSPSTTTRQRTCRRTPSDGSTSNDRCSARPAPLDRWFAPPSSTATAAARRCSRWTNASPERHARPAGLGAHGTRPADRPPIRGLPQRPLTSQRGTPGTSMPASRRPNVPQRDSGQRAGALSGLGNPARVAAWIIRS
jgi:hypothetical protein